MWKSLFVCSFIVLIAVIILWKLLKKPTLDELITKQLKIQEEINKHPTLQSKNINLLTETMKDKIVDVMKSDLLKTSPPVELKQEDYSSSSANLTADL